MSQLSQFLRKSACQRQKCPLFADIKNITVKSHASVWVRSFSDFCFATTHVAQRCAAVRGLVTLIAVLDKKVDTALKGGVGADFGVMG